MTDTATAHLLDRPSQELELDFCSVLIYERLSFVHVQWNDGMSVEDYKSNIMQLLQIMAKLKITYLLSDAHRLTLGDHNEWMLKFCVPFLIKTNVKKIARIVPYDLASITLNQKLVDVKTFKSDTKKLVFDFEAFTDMEAAFHWLNLPDTGRSGLY